MATWIPYVAAAAATTIAGYLQSEAEKKAGLQAAEYQKDASMAAIAEQRRQFNEIQKLLAPYVEAGNTSLTKQLALLGLGGPDAQQQAVTEIEQSPFFTSMVRQGEESILQSASAGGKLRGGDTKEFLARYRPELLRSELDRKFNQLGQITNVGQASAAQTSVAGGNAAGNIGNFLMAGGDAQAQAALLSGRADSRFYGALGGAGNILAAGYLYNEDNPDDGAAKRSWT